MKIIQLKAECVVDNSLKANIRYYFCVCVTTVVMVQCYSAVRLQHVFNESFLH